MILLVTRACPTSVKTARWRGLICSQKASCKGVQNQVLALQPLQNRQRVEQRLREQIYIPSFDSSKATLLFRLKFPNNNSNQVYSQLTYCNFPMSKWEDACPLPNVQDGMPCSLQWWHKKTISKWIWNLRVLQFTNFTFRNSPLTCFSRGTQHVCGERGVSTPNIITKDQLWIKYNKKLMFKRILERDMSKEKWQVTQTWCS